LLLLGVGCYGGRSYTQERTSVVEGSKVVVLIRVQATCPEGDLRDATKHWLRGRMPYLSGFNIALTVGEFESGGKPVVVLPESPDDSSCDQGWHYVVVPPGPTYLGMGSFWRMTEQADKLGSALPTVERRVDVPMNSKIVYAGTWWTQCTVGPHPLADSVTMVHSVRLSERGITSEINEARAIALRCFPELGDPVFVESQEIDLKAPRVIRIPPAQRSR